jgi:hypothetical protein
MLTPEILPSARKHGISDEDMMHAFRNRIRESILDGQILAIGPDQNGNLLELVYKIFNEDLVIFHAMKIRPRHLRIVNLLTIWNVEIFPLGVSYHLKKWPSHQLSLNEASGTRNSEERFLSPENPG